MDKAKKKKNPPVVRQTLTSKMRLLKANPLLRYELERKHSLINNTKLKPLVSVVNDKELLDTSKVLFDNFYNRNNNEMVVKLTTWLQDEGKNVEDFENLKAFGDEPVDKENIPEVDTLQIAQEALKDLHKLIYEGYSVEQCATWLKLITAANQQVQQHQDYWECRAALEQVKGNLNEALDCYKKAIIQGADVETVEQLLQKFSLLKINNTEMNNNKRNKSVLKEAQNICKSSIIQFAVQEKTVKKKDDDGFRVERTLVATPVRRSTRLSRHQRFCCTPGVKLFSSIQDIDDDLKENINFRCNNALKE